MRIFAPAFEQSRNPAASNLTRPVQGSGRRHSLPSKLTIGPVDDPLEREADTLAERVIRMEAPAQVHPADVAIQRRCAACESETKRTNEDESPIQAKASPSSKGPATADVHAAARAVEHGGAPLPGEVRSYFEPRFGHDFSRVRIHADGQAAAAARAVRARAFTLGSDIVFDGGEYAPSTLEGRRLIAHELAHVLQQRSATGQEPAPGARLIQRQTKPSAPTAPTVQDFHDFVQATIDQFNAAAPYYGEPLVKVSAALFEKLINTWYAMVVDRQTMIKDHLNDDALLQRDLQAAYIAAIRALVSKNAYRLEGESQGVRKQAEIEDELYRVNSGRIPMWAWPTPHRQEAGFSTPLAEGQAVDPLSGNVAFTTPSGIQITILPDGIDANIKTDGATRLSFPFNVPFTTVAVRGVRVIDSFTPPAPVAIIQTLYLPGTNAAGTSGYGRGTTPEDIAGGKVDPASTTVRWHEGSHGLDYQEFLKNTTMPVFTGTKGMTEAAFRAAVRSYGSALHALFQRADALTISRTHCVGTTIDQFNQAHAAPGAVITLECGP
jgi:hypothetical protein